MKRGISIALSALWFFFKLIGYIILLLVYALSALFGPILTNIATVTKSLLAQYKLL